MERTDQVRTPISQALADGVLSRTELKALMQRSDWPAFLWLAIWLVVLFATGSLIYFTKDSLLIWPAMVLHGLVLVHHFSLQHECVHYTPFKTRWLNDFIGNICGLIIILPHRFFLCGGGSGLPGIKKALLSPEWCKNLPFAKVIEASFLQPRDVVNISDKTGALRDPQDITPMGLANLALDLIGEEKVMSGILRRAVKMIQK